MKFNRVVAACCLLFAPLLWAAEPTKAPKPTAELKEKGKTVFTTACAACHGEAGRGDGPAAVAMNPKPRDFATGAFTQGSRVEDLFRTVTDGVKETQMVGWSHLPEEDRWAVAYHVLDLIPKAHRGKKPGKD